MDTGLTWVRTSPGNSWSVDLNSAGDPITATLYVDIYHNSSAGDYLVSAGGTSQVLHKTTTGTSLYAIQVSFDEDVTVELRSLGGQSFSAFTLAAVILDNGVLISPEGGGGRLAEAISSIEASLDPDFWTDDRHLEPETGINVFGLEQEAVGALLDLLEEPGDFSSEVLAWFEVAIEDLVLADRELADQKIRDVTAIGGPDPSEILDFIAQADELFADGDAAGAAGQFIDAIELYSVAWSRAIQAMRFQEEVEGNEPT